MKFKKGKILRSLALIGSLGVIVSVPIITTSCNTQSVSAEQKTPTLQKNISIIIPYTDIYSENKTNLEGAISDYLNKNENKSQIIENASQFNSDEINSMQFVVDSKINDEFLQNTTWGSNEYDSWSTSAKKLIYQPEQSLQITPSTNFYKLLQDADSLKNLLKSTGLEINEGDTVALNESDKPKVINNSYNVSVSVTSSNATLRNATNYNLEIPFSSLDVKVDKLDLTITSNNSGVANSTSGSTSVLLDVACNSTSLNESFFKNGITLKTGETVTTDAVMDELGIKKTNPVTSGYNLIQNTHNETKSHTQNIDQEKLASLLEIYNVNFENFNVTSIVEGATGPAKEGYNGLFDVTVDATPNKGFKWEDGSESKKTITISNALFKVKVTSWDSGIARHNSDDTKQINLESRDQEGVNKYFAIQENIDSVVKFWEGQLKNFIFNGKLKYRKAAWAPNNNGINVYLQIVPKDGCDYKDTHPERSSNLTVLFKNITPSKLNNN